MKYNFLNINIFLLFLFLSWFLILILTQSPALFPLTSSSFETTSEYLRQIGLVLPSGIAPLLFVFETLLGPLLLCMWFLLIYIVLPGNIWSRLSFSFFIVTIFYPWGEPGNSWDKLSPVVLATCLLLPLSKRAHPLLLWALVTLLLFLIQYEKTQFLFFWMACSILIAEGATFLLGNKAHIPKKYKIEKKNVFTLIGTLFLIVCVLFTFWPNRFQPTPSSWAWSSVVLLLLCILMTLKKPWKTSQWLTAALFGFGLFLSPRFELPVFLVGLWMLLQFLEGIFIFRENAPFVLHSFLSYTCITLIILALGFMTFHVFTKETSKSFNTAWTHILLEIDLKNPKGYLVVGQGIPVLAHFFPKKLMQNDQLLLESSETKLINDLKEKGISDILIEKTYFNTFWRTWLEENKDSSMSNLSVLSKILDQEEQETKLKSLQLLKETKDFAWITINNF